MARQITWVPPSGAPLILTDPAAGYSVKAAGTSGLWDLPYRHSAETHAGVPGASLQSLEADARPVTLGLKVQAPTPAEFRARWRTLVRAMRPKAGDGRLVVADEDGGSRTLTCRYVGGLGGDAEALFSGTEGRAVAEFVAFDNPWWEGDERTVDFGLAAPTNFFPLFPVRLSPSSIQGEFTVDLSDADAPCYPRWTVTGPGAALTLANTTTDPRTGLDVVRTIQVNAELGDGQTMVIDTRSGEQEVRAGDGANLMGRLSSDPALWPLLERENRITALLTNAGANSRIVGRYTPRYAGI